MTHQIIRIHPDAPRKPVLGAPCNGCGVCCLAEPCPLGMVLSRKRTGACVALIWADDGADAGQGAYRCGALAAPEQVLAPRWRWLAPVLRRLAARWISAGSGCDAALEVATPSRR